MQSNVWKKLILIMGSLVFVFSLVNIVGAGMGSNSDHDSVITSMVVNKLQNDSQLQGSSIDVETVGGEVTLKGMVNSQADITRAGQLANSVEGINKVDNRLKTFSSPAFGVTPPRPNCQIGANWAC